MKPIQRLWVKGKPAGAISRYDLTCSLLNKPSASVGGPLPASAEEIMARLLLDAAGLKYEDPDGSDKEAAPNRGTPGRRP
jgi:hypothetical protein